MKKIIILLAFAIASLNFSNSFASTSERLKAAGENITGSTQETAGNMTNDSELKAKGKINKAKGKLRNTKEDAKEKLNQLDQ